ncbi:MT-A70-domain-containing protein, partial [Rhodotorula sp. JG-1b]
VPDEETLRNDYAGQYVQTGARPQNHLRNTAVETRFAEYPKLAALLDHKHALTSSPLHSIPPTYLNLSSSNSPASTETTHPSPMSLALTETLTSTSSSSVRFDSILLTPPPSTTYEELKSLDLGRVAANPGFVWLWVGSGQQDGIGLEKGRELLSLWGYRRCEDIVWLKTNKRDPEADLPTSLFTPTIEHCLMGIRGTVRRSTDSFLVHCNVDTDVLIWEGDEQDPDLKPPELQSLIENFCLGTRRLHLYGSPHSLRRGWLTL